jgi:hypothetical protein
MRNTPQLAPLSTFKKKRKAGLAAQFVSVTLLDTARLAARSFILLSRD